MFLLLLILLLIAVATGSLGAVLKATVVIVLSVILAMVVLVWGTFYYLRYRMRRFARDVERHRRSFPTQGRNEPGPGPSGGPGPGELPG